MIITTASCGEYNRVTGSAIGRSGISGFIAAVEKDREELLMAGPSSSLHINIQKESRSYSTVVESKMSSSPNLLPAY
jgi:hypothetical protein